MSEPKRFVLRADIEAVAPNGDCTRPLLQDVLLAESDVATEIEQRLGQLEQFVGADGETEWGDGRYTEYTVFAWVMDEAHEAGQADDCQLDYEETHLGQYTNLVRAKQLLTRVIKQNSKLELPS